MRRLNKSFIIINEPLYDRASALHEKAYRRASKRFMSGKCGINLLFAYGFVRICNDNISKAILPYFWD